MDYLDLVDNMDLSELFGFLEYRNNYKDMMNSYEDSTEEVEFIEGCKREERQLKYLEKKESV